MTAVTPWVFGVARPVRERFEEKFRVTPSCWLWLDYKTAKGYGRMSVAGKNVMAHRLSYEIYVGAIPAGKIICHTCDNPACVNPDHLWPGTDQTNAQDKMSKGRWKGGTRKQGQELSYAKLREEDVYAIRADERSYSEIGRSYGIGASHARAIKLHEKWTHLQPRSDEKASADGRIKTPRLSLERQRLVLEDTRPRSEIAAEFGINPWTVDRIKNGGDGYRHLRAPK